MVIANMKNLLLLSIILIFFAKTGNVLSNNSIFNVNNIEISKDSYKSKEQLLTIAFKKGFKKLTERILLQKDIKKIASLDSMTIKNLVSHYQIIENYETDSQKVLINLYFDRNRLNSFFMKKNLQYSDIVNTEVVILPILINNQEIFIYDNNFFYNNWKKEKQKDNLIEYSIPLENLESIEKIKKNKNNLENLEVSEIISSYDVSNYIFIIIESDNNKTKVFLKSKIFDKKVVKNIHLSYNLKDKDLYPSILIDIKKNIEEIIKSQNLVDIRTPTFLNVNLKIDKLNDLYAVKSILQEIELIENFRVQELNKNFVKIKIKFYGKIEKIYQHLKDKGIKIEMQQNQWNLKII